MPLTRFTYDALHQWFLISFFLIISHLRNEGVEKGRVDAAIVTDGFKQVGSDC